MQVRWLSGSTEEAEGQVPLAGSSQRAGRLHCIGHERPEQLSRACAPGLHESELPVETNDTATPQTALQSSFYEQLVEHVFISEILQEAWYRHQRTIEVLRSEIDASGYDVVLECNGIIRHVQLKTSAKGGKTAYQNVNVRLSDKPGGCIVWLVREEDPTGCRMRLGYLFFGGLSGERLPPLEGYPIARHTKGDSTGFKRQRLGIRRVPKTASEWIDDTTTLLERLFGIESASASATLDSI